MSTHSNYCLANPLIFLVHSLLYHSCLPMPAISPLWGCPKQLLRCWRKQCTTELMGFTWMEQFQESMGSHICPESGPSFPHRLTSHSPRWTTSLYPNLPHLLLHPVSVDDLASCFVEKNTSHQKQTPSTNLHPCPSLRYLVSFFIVTCHDEGSILRPNKSQPSSWPWIPSHEVILRKDLTSFIMPFPGIWLVSPSLH